MLRTLLAILRSSDFQRDLSELSAYAAKMKHERPIVLLCAKHLRRARRDIIVEGGQYDLTVDGVTFAFKQHFDFDVPKALRELEESKWRQYKSTTWRVVPGIYEDIIEGRPDVFVWIISQRNLDGLSKEYGKSHVGYWSQRCGYAKLGWTSGEMLRKANGILNRIAASRRGRRHSVSVETRALFGSTYHFLIRSFRGGRNPRGPKG